MLSEKTLILNIQYDGTNYSGWQKQPNARTVQETLENALMQICGKEIKIMGAGRTDAGVHARNMTAHGNIDDSFTIPENKITAALNANLPYDININNSIVYQGEFHARFDAVMREYTFNIITKPDVFKQRFAAYYKFAFDENLLFESAQIFLKKTDFTTFSKYNPDINNPVCNVDICEWTKIADCHYMLRIRANHFLYGVVRALTGAMLDCARGKRTKEELETALLLKDRSLASPLISPQGLIFEKAYYPVEYGID